MPATTPSAPGPHYAVVVPAYSEEALLPATLDNLREQMRELEPWQGELIVVDNASTDRTAAIAEEHGATVVHETHRQIARARNAGAAHASAPCLVFVDADTLVSAELLREAVDSILNKNVTFVGAMVAFPPEAPRSARRGAGFWNFLSRTFTWACGAFVCCRRDAFEAIGGFDERYYASEEIHLSGALKKWARRHQSRCRILRTPIVTSDRKTTWYTTSQLLLMLLRFVFAPWSVRNREACWLWYRRPPEE